MNETKTISTSDNLVKDIHIEEISKKNNPFNNN